MNLFIDTTNWNLIILLEKDGQIVDSVIKRDTKKVSDIFISSLNEFLSKHQLTLKEIENLYVTTGPGSYTGVRIGLLFVKTLKTIDDHYQTYVINSLAYQAGLEKVISVLDARGQKFFVGVYENGKPLIEEQLVTQEELDAIKAKYQFNVVADYQELDFAKNFLALKDSFELIKDYKNLLPLYLKKPV